MISTKNPGRFAGLLYIFMGIPGFFAIEYVPSKLIEHGNAAPSRRRWTPQPHRPRLPSAGNVTDKVRSSTHSLQSASLATVDHAREP